MSRRKLEPFEMAHANHAIARYHGRDPFAEIERITGEYIRAGYDVVMPNGHVVNKAERDARALVEAEMPS